MIILTTDSTHYKHFSVIKIVAKRAFNLKGDTGCARAYPRQLQQSGGWAASAGISSLETLLQSWTHPHRAAQSLSAAVELRSHGHGLHRLPGPVPGWLGSVYLHKLSRTAETSDGEPGGEPAAQWADRRDTQTAGIASEGGSLTNITTCQVNQLHPNQLRLVFDLSLPDR